MKRIVMMLFAVALALRIPAVAGVNGEGMRVETHFLTDKMAYELSLDTRQYNDVYEINYDFMATVRPIMDYVVRGYEWALNDYYEALDIRNDDLRWVLSDGQYRRFLGADYFYRPLYVTGGRWSFRVYANYPNRRTFYYGVPSHYYTYCGAHYRPHLHHASYYRDRYVHIHHYSTPYRVRDHRMYHNYRRSDFGSVRFRTNSSIRPNHAPVRSNTRGYTRSESNRRYEVPGHNRDDRTMRSNRISGHERNSRSYESGRNSRAMSGRERTSRVSSDRRTGSRSETGYTRGHAGQRTSRSADRGESFRR